MGRASQRAATQAASSSTTVTAMQATTLPMRVIDGAFDPISGAHMVARYRELVPNPDCVLLEAIGHYPQVEAPDAVLQHYLAFRDDKEV